MVSKEKVTLARLTFSNVPTKSGGVISGNISTGAGSPFGSGGKYESQVAHIKAEIAKKPAGYYDPLPMTLWKGENIALEFEGLPYVMKAREELWRLNEQLLATRRRGASESSKAQAPALKIAIKQKEDQIARWQAEMLAEKNAPVILAQLEQQAKEADLQRHLEIELAVQLALEKQLINQRPTAEPTAPAVTSTFPIIPIIIIAVIVGIFLLRRRAK